LAWTRWRFDGGYCTDILQPQRLRGICGAHCEADHGFDISWRSARHSEHFLMAFSGCPDGFHPHSFDRESGSGNGAEVDGAFEDDMRAAQHASTLLCIAANIASMRLCKVWLYSGVLVLVTNSRCENCALRWALQFRSARMVAAYSIKPRSESWALRALIQMHGQGIARRLCSRLIPSRHIVVNFQTYFTNALRLSRTKHTNSRRTKTELGGEQGMQVRSAAIRN
jgi:hypothetical protein